MKTLFTGLFSNILTRSTSSILVCVLTLSLQGCDTFFPKTVAEICKEKPYLCSDLNPDAWCRAEKAEIIKHRYLYSADDSDAPKYTLMLMFEDYEACIVKASGIQHIKYREKETGRYKGVRTAQSELRRLAKETRHSDNPYLSFYQWSRFGHEDALTRFMDHNDKGNLSTPELQIALSTVQVKYDLFEARKSIYQALSLYTSEDEINTEIFSTLVTIHLKLDKTQMAYVWALVTSYFAEDDINRQRRDAMVASYDLDQSLLEDIADEIISAIKRRSFDSEKLGIANI